jgi:hypothetical protein
VEFLELEETKLEEKESKQGVPKYETRMDILESFAKTLDNSKKIFVDFGFDQLIVTYNNMDTEAYSIEEVMEYMGSVSI